MNEPPRLPGLAGSDAPVRPVRMPAPAKRPRGRFARARLALAFAVAAVSDLLSVAFSLLPPFQWALDIATALSLWVILGWRWQILPGLIAEAIPGLEVFPVWVLVVAVIYPSFGRDRDSQPVP